MNETATCHPSTSSESGYMGNNDVSIEMQRLVLHSEPVMVPALMVLNEAAFRSVVTIESFKRLSPALQLYLKKFLPETENENEERAILDAVFTTDKNFNFGNPIEKFHGRMRAGSFLQIPPERVQLRDNQRVMYDHYIRFYQINLLKKLLASRHALIQHYSSCSPFDEPGPVPLDAASQIKREQYIKIQARASKRAKLMISDCRSRVGEIGVSSDEEEEECSLGRVTATAAGRTTLHSANFKDMDLHQPIYIDDVKTMRKKYKKLLKLEPKTPSIDISDINLDDVLERSGVQSVSERIRQTKQTLENMSK